MNTLSIFCFLILNFISLNLFAQSITFEKTFGTPSGDEGNCARQTYDNGYIMLHTYRGDGSTIMGSTSLIKTDSLGNEEWQKGNLSTAFVFTWVTSLEITSDSGYIVIGHCMYINESTNTHTLVSKTDQYGI